MFSTGCPSDRKGRTHQPRRIGTKEIKVGNIQAAQIIANADLVIVNSQLVMVMVMVMVMVRVMVMVMVMIRQDRYLVFM